MRVLFVGNSYTSRNALPELVRRLAGSARALDVASVTRGGCTIASHVKSAALARALEAPVDVIVLQEQSRMPVLHADAMLRAVEAFVALRASRAPDASVVLYATWAREGSPHEQQQITSAYARCASATGARLALVGDAFARARAIAGAPRLYDDDGSHPSAAGSLLAAVVLCEAITGAPPDDAALEAAGVPAALREAARAG